jgi:hypothetical protein
MKKHYASILVTFVCFFGLAFGAKAEGRDQVVVTLSHAFVVNGKTLPAGTYTVSRLGDNELGGLVLTNRENRSSVVVLPSEVESARANMPQISFEQVGEERFLSKIQTSHDIYTIPVSRAVIMEATAISHDHGSSSGSSGSN